MEADPGPRDRQLSHGEQILREWMAAVSQTTPPRSGASHDSTQMVVAAAALALKSGGPTRPREPTSTLNVDRDSSESLSPDGAKSPTSRSSTTAQMMSTMLDMRHSSNQMRRAELSWTEPPREILIITKLDAKEVDDAVSRKGRNKNCVAVVFSSGNINDQSCKPSSRAFCTRQCIDVNILRS